MPGEPSASPHTVGVIGALLDTYADPRYRPSVWLRRRAALGVPLAGPDAAASPGLGSDPTPPTHERF